MNISRKSNPRKRSDRSLSSAAKVRPINFEIIRGDQVTKSAASQKVETQSKIAMPISKGFVFLDSTEILYCESYGNYSKVKTSATTHIVSLSLKACQALLPETHFFRPHSKYVVNKNEVVKLIAEEGMNLWVSDGQQIPVSRAKKKMVKDFLL